MSRKDYEKAARELRETCPRWNLSDDATSFENALDTWRRCVVIISHVFLADNPRFDEMRFFTACEPEVTL